jgi:hypothetical protein
MREHREQLIPIQIWVPDVRALSFRAEARRQSLVLASAASEMEDQAFVDAITSDRA